MARASDLSGSWPPTTTRRTPGAARRRRRTARGSPSRRPAARRCRRRRCRRRLPTPGAQSPPLLVGEQPGTEALEVDAVAEVAHLAARGEMQSADHLDVLDVLHELGVGPARGERFERVDERRRGHGIVRRGVEPVHRVDDDGHAGQPADDPAVQPGLGVVRVQHRRPLASQHPPQLDAPRGGRRAGSSPASTTSGRGGGRRAARWRPRTAQVR